MKKIIAIFVILIIILSLRFFFFYQNQPQLKHGQSISFETRIFSSPKQIGNKQVLTANYQNNKIRITTARYPELNYGDMVAISGKISNQHDAALMYFPKIEMTERSSDVFDKSLKAVNNLRQNLISLFARTLPTPSSSLLMGIIFGIKEQMPKDFSDNLKTTGVFHVIAASGMNVTLIGGFISTFFAFFLKRQIAIGLSILGIIFYAVLAGLEASIIRASIMGILVFSSQILGRQSLAINGLIFAGFAMLFIDPTLASDIGFQLSFTATAGILFIKKVPTTIAAQITTLPILLANFGTYSVYSILVNGLVLWTVPILMMVGGVGALLGLILEPLGQLLIYLCYPLLLYFENVVNFFGKIGGVINISALTFPFIAGYYCLLASVLVVFKKTRSTGSG